MSRKFFPFFRVMLRRGCHRFTGLPKFLFPESYNKPCDFNINNLPYGCFTTGHEAIPRIGVAIGDKVLDLTALAKKGELHSSLSDTTLNKFISQGKDVWATTRTLIRQLLSDDSSHSLAFRPGFQEYFVAQSDCQMHLPVNIGDYTDFYASESHATNVGRMFRGNENALMPNWKSLPVGYHGRSSSVVVSGTPIKRPHGQVRRGDETIFTATTELDFELELACILGPGNSLGTPIEISRAEDHMFGFVLMNDWSARDIQRWEYQPLGPFLGKNFGTTISPWIVPLAALEPFRVALPAQNPKPLPYLASSTHTGYDLDLTVEINGSVVTKSNAKFLYWSFPQQVAHHTINGCNIRAGDLIGSGTISGEEISSFGSMLELNWNKTRKIAVGTESRTFLDDGDFVKISGSTIRGENRIGFGDCTGLVLP